MSARYLKYIIYLHIWKNMTSPPTRARSATTSNSLWSSAWILSKTAGFRTSTMWKSKELVKRLTPFVAPGDAALMERHLYIDSRVKAINEGVYISVDLCHAAPSQHSRIKSSGYCLDSSSRNMFIQVELRRFTKGYYIKQPNMDCQPTEFTALSRHRAVFSWAGKGGIPICGA